MTNNEKLIEVAVARALSDSDDRNHEDLCHCGDWPASCVTYGDRKPWSHDAESVARTALAVFEKAHTPTDDEREAAEEIADGLLSDDEAEGVRQLTIGQAWDLAFDAALAGFRRSEVPEPSVEDRNRRAIDALSWRPDHDGVDPARVEDDYMRRAQAADAALAILTENREGAF